MSDCSPAALNACLSNGRSLFSQRGDVVASGRITPTFPLALLWLLVLLPPDEPPLLPHAVAASPATASAATRPSLAFLIAFSSIFAAALLAAVRGPVYKPRIRSTTNWSSLSLP